MGDGPQNIEETTFRLDGLEYALEESVPQLIGALVLHLARAGVLDLGAFGREIRACHHADLRLEDSTGLLFSALGDLVDAYREDGELPARREVVLEIPPRS